jgi:hypothetical protein
MNNLLSIFDNRFGSIKFNKTISDEIYNNQIRFITKGQEYIEFFGGNLTGVHVVKFTPNDENNYYDILDTTKEEISDLVDKAPGINKNFIVSSDPFNLLNVYISHKCLVSNFLNEKQKTSALFNNTLLLNYRFLTSIMNHFYRYPIEKGMAEVVYNNLSFKFILKQQGTWSKTLEYRANQILDKNGIHYDTFKKFNDDNKIIYLLNDSQGRLRDMIKNIYREYLRVKESGTVYKKTTNIQLDEENGDSFKDKSNGLEVYKNYLFTIVQNETDYIKEELISLILDLVPAITRETLINTLEYVVENLGKHSYIDKYLDLCVVYSYNQMINDIDILSNNKDIGHFLLLLKNYYQSSKNKEPDLLEIRDLGNKLAEDSLKVKTRIVITTARTAHFLYTVLRTYTRNYYNNH